jgi:hypothetical protein
MTIKQTIKDGVAFLEQTIEELTAERDYLDGRLAEFENMARDFIKLEYDNVLRERLEKILYKESEE